VAWGGGVVAVAFFAARVCLGWGDWERVGRRWGGWLVGCSGVQVVGVVSCGTGRRRLHGVAGGLHAGDGGGLHAWGARALLGGFGGLVWRGWCVLGGAGFFRRTLGSGGGGLSGAAGWGVVRLFGVTDRRLRVGLRAMLPEGRLSSVRARAGGPHQLHRGGGWGAHCT